MVLEELSEINQSDVTPFNNEDDINLADISPATWKAILYLSKKDLEALSAPAILEYIHFWVDQYKENIQNFVIGERPTKSYDAIFEQKKRLFRSHRNEFLKVLKYIHNSCCARLHEIDPQKNNPNGCFSQGIMLFGNLRKEFRDLAAKFEDEHFRRKSEIKQLANSQIYMFLAKYD